MRVAARWCAWGDAQLAAAVASWSPRRNWVFDHTFAMANMCHACWHWLANNVSLQSASLDACKDRQVINYKVRQLIMRGCRQLVLGRDARQRQNR